MTRRDDERFAERCEAYLDGALNGEETRRFERELTLEENAEVFRQVLVMRQLLADLPPDSAPADLVSRIEAELLRGVVEAAAEEEREQRGSGLRTVLWGTSWALRGPAMAVSAGSAGGGGQQVLSGLDTVRYAAGPLALRSAAPKKRPLWRRLLRRRLLGR